MKKVIRCFLVLLSISNMLYAEGWFSMSSGHDPVNGNGEELSLEIEQPLRKPLSLTGTITTLSFETYQDLVGTIGLEWAYNERTIVGIGYSYDRFSTTDDSSAPFYSRNVYGRLKVRLW